MIKNLLFALSLITLPVIIESCCSAGWRCCDLPAPRTYSVNNLTMKTTTFDGTKYVDAPSQIKPKDMSFNFTLDVTYLSMYKRKTIRPTMAAYACEPKPNYSREKITAMTITSDQVLELSDQSVIPAGSDIKNYFNYGWPFEDSPFFFESFNMVPNFYVPTAEDHEFTFRFTLDDGRIFELRSGIHKLMP